MCHQFLAFGMLQPPYCLLSPCLRVYMCRISVSKQSCGLPKFTTRTYHLQPELVKAGVIELRMEGGGYLIALPYGDDVVIDL